MIDAIHGRHARPRAAGADDRADDLNAEQRAWAEHSESLWRRAHAIAEQFPDCDVTDIYHALRCLELTPSQRLAAGLRRGRLRAQAR